MVALEQATFLLEDASDAATALASGMGASVESVASTSRAVSGPSSAATPSPRRIEDDGTAAAAAAEAAAEATELAESLRVAAAAETAMLRRDLAEARERLVACQAALAKEQLRSHQIREAAEAQATEHRAAVERAQDELTLHVEKYHEVAAAYKELRTRSSKQEIVHKETIHGLKARLATTERRHTSDMQRLRVKFAQELYMARKARQAAAAAYG